MVIISSPKSLLIASFGVILLKARIEPSSSLVVNSPFHIVSPFIRVQSYNTQSSTLYSTSNSSKKKKSALSPGKGFGKQQQQEENKVLSVEENLDKSARFISIDDRDTTSSSLSSSVVTSSKTSPSLAADKPIEERTKEILRQKYGLTTMEEKLGRLEELDRQDSARKTLSKMDRALKKKVEEEKENNFISSIPPEILSGLSTFLQFGTGLSVLLFVLAGIGITWEAWIVSTHPENVLLPPQVDTFITQVVEPNFTLGLFVLLFFSISLGLLSSAQLGSSSSVYQEKD